MFEKETSFLGRKKEKPSDKRQENHFVFMIAEKKKEKPDIIVQTLKADGCFEKQNLDLFQSRRTNEVISHLGTALRMESGNVVAKIEGDF